MTDSAQPFAAKKFLEIKGRRMAYIDEGEGAPIVFAHGNPTSSYLWRNVMPACRGLGRLIACDMIGMGESEKLPDSGPDRYTYAEPNSHRRRAARSSPSGHRLRSVASREPYPEAFR